MEHHDRFPVHWRQVITAADFIQLAAASVERAPGVAAVFSVQQPAMTRERVALNPPVVKEPHVGPELLAAGRHVRHVLHRFYRSAIFRRQQRPGANRHRQRRRTKLPAAQGIFWACHQFFRTLEPLIPANLRYFKISADQCELAV